MTSGYSDSLGGQQPISTITGPDIRSEPRKSHSAPARRTYGESTTSSSYFSSRSSSGNNNGSGTRSGGWRKFGESVFGHAPYIGTLIGEMKSPSKWTIVVNIFYSILHSVSATTFVSNPLSGLVILVTMLFCDRRAALLGLVATLAGIASFWPLGLPVQLLVGGSVTFNCFLLGSLLPLAGEETHSWQGIEFLIPLAAVLGIFVVYLWSGFNGILARVDIPVLSAPTNLLALLLVYSGYFLQFSHGPELPSLTHDDDNRIHNKSEDTFQSDCNCSISNQLWSGVVLSQGVIFQVPVAQSYIIYLSVFIYSPILFCQEVLGGVIGTIIGMGLDVNGACSADVCNGVWGYNSLLTAAALGGYFVRFNFHSFLLSIIGAIVSGFMCAVLKKSGVPILGIPFMLSTWILLPLAKMPSSNESSKLRCGDLQRVVVFSTPELNSFCKNKFYSRVKYTQQERSTLHI
ncbi:Urea transporter 1 [Folsomia candida]|uniref:Urea transporter 1 n=2 Tax=Folsomia candida TaxID=158441 RepID=A0A226EP51_FOLCA|nr:Urea transporter 1 [Folsomia candida]